MSVDSKKSAEQIVLILDAGEERSAYNMDKVENFSNRPPWPKILHRTDRDYSLNEHTDGRCVISRILIALIRREKQTGHRRFQPIRRVMRVECKDADMKVARVCDLYFGDTMQPPWSMRNQSQFSGIEGTSLRKQSDISVTETVPM